jgi:hypothetical protein
VRCPACGARNPDTAEWCSQCYATLTEPDPTPDPAPGTGPDPGPPPPDVSRSGAVAPPGRAAATTGGAAATGTGGVVGASERFRQTDEGIDWRCEVCDSWSPIERTTCATCGAPFARAVEAVGPEPSELVSENTALVASVVLPGLGHYLMARRGQGVARMAVFLTWFVGGLVLLASALGAGASILPAVPLLAGAVIVWLASVADALTLHRGRGRELLRPRVLLWLTVVVIGATMLSFAAAALSLGATA